MKQIDAEPNRMESPTVWECFATAVHFLTRITVSRSLAIRKDFNHAWALNRAVVFFPLLGGLIGVVTASVMIGFMKLGVSPLLAAFLALGTEAFITGAFHEDAFADTCDALGGGWTRERVLEIMKDSCLGTYGTIALVLGVSIRALAMEATTINGITWAFTSIVAAAMFARLVIVIFMATTLPIPSRHSQARDVSGKQPVTRVLVSMLLALPFGIVWCFQAPLTAAVSILICILVIFWYRQMILRVIGGTTGDTLGAIGYLSQLVVLIGASVA